jgi:hypothetical protein
MGKGTNKATPTHRPRVGQLVTGQTRRLPKGFSTVIAHKVLDLAPHFPRHRLRGAFSVAGSVAGSVRRFHVPFARSLPPPPPPPQASRCPTPFTEVQLNLGEAAPGF